MHGDLLKLTLCAMKILPAILFNVEVLICQTEPAAFCNGSENVGNKDDEVIKKDDDDDKEDNDNEVHNETNSDDNSDMILPLFKSILTLLLTLLLSLPMSTFKTSMTKTTSHQSTSYGTPTHAHC